MTQGFRPAKMELEFPHHPEWEVPLDSSVLQILDQPFHFIGKGSQAYVFESENGNYVVKFFRFDRNSFLKKFLAKFWSAEETGSSLDVKVCTAFNACKIAFQSLREETGLIYMHLNLSSMNLPVLHCKDAIGRNYRFPLDRYRFVVQKKATLFRQVLIGALSDPEEMRRRIDQFIELLQSRTAKGVFNTDPTLSRNFGFLKDRAVEIDFGNYRDSANHSPFVELKRYTDRLRRWLITEAPDWVPYLDDRVDEICRNPNFQSSCGF